MSDIVNKIIPDYVIEWSGYDHRIIHHLSEGNIKDDLIKDFIDNTLYVGYIDWNNNKIKDTTNMYVPRKSYPYVRDYVLDKDKYVYKNKVLDKSIVRIKETIDVIIKQNKLFGGYIVRKNNEFNKIERNEYCRCFGQGNTKIFEINSKIIMLRRYDCESG